MPPPGVKGKKDNAEHRRFTEARDFTAVSSRDSWPSPGYEESISAVSAPYRGIERQVATLERQMALLQRRVLSIPAAAPTASTTRKVRFVAKGLKSQRARLGLSAADYGRLVGVSAQSIYNWEQGQASPRPEQVKIVAALRGISKREVPRRLEQLSAKGSKGKRPRKG